ncbi:MAG: TraY domain-containing protein [Burkholderiales bacterium]|nr:TraY domain-containing protein [Burkholderiales bacterium]
MTTSIRLPVELDARLEKLASKTGRSKTFYIKQAIEEHITDLEDFYLAERRMRANDPAENATLDEMLTRHGVAR